MSFGFSGPEYIDAGFATGRQKRFLPRPKTAGVCERAAAQFGYRASAWAGDRRSPVLRALWDSLISSRNPSTAVYQTPAYAEYLHDTGRKLDVLTITDETQSELVGVVPVQHSTVALPFAFKDRVLAKLRLKGLILLGSEPMIPENPGALDKLFLLLSRNFPESQVIDFYSIPLHSYLWRYLQSSSLIKALFHVHVMHGFRESHYVSVPDSLDSYYKSLSRKRRYNLQRQEKLLEQHLGSALELTVVENPEQLPELYRAIEELGIPKTHVSLLGKDQYASAAAHQLLRCFVLKAGRQDRRLGSGREVRKDLLDPSVLPRQVAGKTLSGHDPLADHPPPSDQRGRVHPGQHGVRQSRLPGARDDHRRAKSQGSAVPPHRRQPLPHPCPFGLFRSVEPREEERKSPRSG